MQAFEIVTVVVSVGFSGLAMVYSIQARELTKATVRLMEELQKRVKNEIQQ